MWIPDNATFTKIQHLKKFVTLVGSLKEATREDQVNANKINQLINNINNPDKHKNWNIYLEIYDLDFYNTNTKEGFYCRSWSVVFEDKRLEIEAKSKHTNDDIGHYGSDFCYNGWVFFQDTTIGRRVYLDDDINTFVYDASNYKKYISNTLNDIQIEIEIW